MNKILRLLFLTLVIFLVSGCNLTEQKKVDITVDLCDYHKDGIEACDNKIIETELFETDGPYQHPLDEDYKNTVYMKTDFSYEIPIVFDKPLKCLKGEKIIVQGKLNTAYGPCSKEQNTKNSYCNYKLFVHKLECK